MSHLHRFYLAQPPVENAREAALTDHEAHHALHVVRLRAGDAIEVFDGAGREWDATVTTTTRHDVRIDLGELREHPAPHVPVTLFQAWLHRDKAIEELIRHGTEIGFARFVFFRSQHSERAPRTNDKWLRTAIEACKQCRRVWLPTFETADSLEAAIKMVTGPAIV
ncbi:MAG: 16S rRNA (uracil(1498)-N(3))-methyltransferase, partial [Candidatus Hydrogenedentes bacterium]|nr:16S rRNA (uracil(1498)-N(3))-methyltransferase [Candidatus Hydrogenedentota bacterium]